MGRHLCSRRGLDPVGDPGLGAGGGGPGEECPAHISGGSVSVLTLAEFLLFLRTETSTASTQPRWVAGALSFAFSSLAQEPVALDTGWSAR